MQADDGWFSRKCRKINHSTSTLSFLVPSFLNFSFSEDGKLLKRIIIVNFVICLMFCYSFLRRMFDSVLLIFFRSLASTESWWLQKYSLCMYWERNNPGIFFHVIYSLIQIDNTLSFQVWNIELFFVLISGLWPWTRREEFEQSGCYSTEQHSPQCFTYCKVNER